MIDLRAFDELGFADYGWLQARHHFSFAGYQDARRMGWGALLVWNDDEIVAGSGFPAHAHTDMEIITYVREGAITHRDSLGNVGRTEAGCIQVMSAGAGIRHSEYNLEDVATRLFQIWIVPETRGGTPSWSTRPFPRDDRSGRFIVLASGFAEDTDALPVRAKARVLGAMLKAGEQARVALDPARHVYLVASSGSVDINGASAGPRDGAAITGTDTLTITATSDAELVLVDAP